MLAINRDQAEKMHAMYAPSPDVTQRGAETSIAAEQTSIADGAAIEVTLDAARLERQLANAQSVNVIRVPRIEIENLRRQNPFLDRSTSCILKACAIASFAMAVPATVGAIMMGGPFGALAPIACVAMGIMFYLAQRPVNIR